MLKIEIFEKPEPEPEPEKIPTLLLDMEVTTTGEFVVFACDARGQRLMFGDLWRLRPDGRQACCSGVNQELGLDLDVDGKIRKT